MVNKRGDLQAVGSVNTPVESNFHVAKQQAGEPGASVLKSSDL